MSAARILVVDDSGTIRRVVDNSLSSAGYRVDVAANGEIGLETARESRPDLVLLDFRMPGMNGFEVGKAIARDRGLHGLPIVLMCTRTDRLPARDLAAIGVLSTLIKPFSPEALVERVRVALVEAEGRSEATVPMLPTISSKPSDEDVSDEDGLDQQDPPDEFSLGNQPTLSRGPPGPPPVTDEGEAIGETMSPPALPEDEDDALGNSGEFNAIASRAISEELKRALQNALESRGIDAAEALAEKIVDQVREELVPSVMMEFVRGELPPDILRRPVPALFGDLTEVPLPEVLQLLKFQGQTGVLDVALETMRFEATFQNGRIHSIRGVNVRAVQRLGRYFVRRGVVTEAQLDEALADPTMALGARLLELGLITDEQLRAAVQAQAEDLMFEMLRCRRGMFGLRRGEIDEDLPFAGFSVDALLFEGLRRIDERSVIGQEVPSVDSTFVRTKDASVEGLSNEEARALNALNLDQARAVHRLANDLDLSIDDAMMLIYRLVILGRARRIRLEGEPEVTPPPHRVESIEEF